MPSRRNWPRPSWSSSPTWTVQAYYQFQAAHAALAILEQSRSLLDECSVGHAARVRRGLEERGAADLAQARRAQMDGQIRSVRQQILVLREQLRCLVGAGPEFSGAAPAPLPEVAGARCPWGSTAGAADHLQAMRWYVRPP